MRLEMKELMHQQYTQKEINLLLVQIFVIYISKVAWNKFTEDGVDKLAEALKINNSLLVLNPCSLFILLVGNNIGDIGANKILSSLKENTQLTLLNLSDCIIENRLL